MNMMKLKLKYKNAIENGAIILIPILKPSFEIAIKEMELNLRYQK